MVDLVFLQKFFLLHPQKTSSLFWRQMINMWSYARPKVEQSLPKETTFLVLVPKTYPNIENKHVKLIKLSSK